jgi:hypothetical protein
LQLDVCLEVLQKGTVYAAAVVTRVVTTAAEHLDAIRNSMTTTGYQFCMFNVCDVTESRAV